MLCQKGTRDNVRISGPNSVQLNLRVDRVVQEQHRSARNTDDDEVCNVVLIGLSDDYGAVREMTGSAEVLSRAKVNRILFSRTITSRMMVRKKPTDTKAPTAGERKVDSGENTGDGGWEARCCFVFFVQS